MARPPGFDVAGRTALVTGGSFGIGRELTRLLLARGSGRILIVGRSAEALEAAQAFALDRVSTFQADLGEPEDVDRLISALPELTPDLSLLINNAGTLVHDDFTLPRSLTLAQDVRREIAVNLDAPVALCGGALPLLKKQCSAAIVNVTSGLALVPKKRAAVYCATKAGFRAFTRALRYQCEDGAPNIRVIEALPPLVETALAADIPFDKMSPEECARIILDGLKSGAPEIYVGATGDLARLARRAPRKAEKLMRDR